MGKQRESLQKKIRNGVCIGCIANGMENNERSAERQTEGGDGDQNKKKNLFWEENNINGHNNNNHQNVSAYQMCTYQHTT